MSIDSFITNLRKNKNIIISVTGVDLKILDPQDNLTSELIEEIKTKKAEILEFYKKNRLKNDSQNIKIIPKAQKQPNYKISSAQKRLYFLNELDKASLAYNLPMILKFEGEIDKQKFNDTFKSLINRHETLRTNFEVVNGEPVQLISNQVEFEVKSYQSKEENVDDIIKEFIKPFDLSKAPLIRAGLIEISSQKHILMVDMHHSITDGTSQTVLMKDFIALYNDVETEELRIHYKDYVEWFNNQLNQEQLNGQKNYWLKCLSGDIPVLNLPIDYARKQNRKKDGDSINLKMNEEETKQLIKFLNERSGVTIFAFFIAAYNVFLSRLCNQDDIIIGCPVVNRPHIELEKTIGLFLNTLPLRNNPKTDKSFSSFLNEVKDNILEAFQNQDYQYEDMVEELNIPRDLNRNPLFDTFFNYVEVEIEETHKIEKTEIIQDLKIAPYKVDQEFAKFDLKISIHKTGNRIVINCAYDKGLFKKSTIQYIFSEFRNLILELISFPNKKLGEFNIFSQKDLPKGENLIHPANSFNNFPEEEINQSVPERFQKIVKRFPNKVAIKTENKQLTYTELDKKTNQLGWEILNNYDDRYSLSEDEKILYSRQIMLDDWGVAGQEKLKSTTAFVAGAGGSGSPVITQLALAGIGKIIVCDFDEVEMSNLNRQFLHDESRIGINKAESAKMTINRINPNVEVVTITEKITSDNIEKIAEDADIIFDNVDNLEAKFALSDYATKKGTPHVISSMMETSSYVCIFHTPYTPCFHCLYNKAAIKDIETIRNKYGKENKSANPVSSSSLFVSAGFAVNESIKILLQNENPAYNKFFFFNQKASKRISETKGYMAIIFPFSDYFKQKSKEQGFDWDIGWSGKFVEELHIERNPDCPICNNTKNITNSQIDHKVDFKNDKREDKKNQTVALLLNHNEKMLVGIMGVLKTGKVYVPIDPNHPENRISEILDDCSARMIVTDNHNYELAKKAASNVNKNIYILNYDELEPTVSDSDLQLKIESNNLCYILYTSGSTGKPKGVMQSHKNVLHFCRVYTNAIHISPEDKLTLLSNYCFDASKMSIYGSLLNGATVYPYSIKESGAEGLKKIIHEEKLTVYHSTPSVFRFFINTLNSNNYCNSLRLVVMGGEAVLASDVENYKKYFANDCLFINGLGPTESTVTLQNFINKNTEVTGECMPVGYSVDKTRVHIIRNDNQLAGVFEFGEILYQSNYLALGYWNEEEKSKQAFPIDIVHTGERYYKSGDVGRMLSNGMIEFKGRNDNQVKIRGLRVELGEIESQLVKHNQIKGAVVIAKEKEGEKYIIAYYAAESELEASELNTFLLQKIPDYMIPSYYVCLEAIPLTLNGKIDKKALPDPEIKLVNDYSPPSNETEEKLVDIWSEVLNIDKEKISVNSSFFDLGGHSLKAILVISKIHNVFDISITLDDYFDDPSITGIASVVANMKKDEYKFSYDNEEREEIEI